MAEFLWYRTSVSTTGVALSDSVEVTVWFGPSPPPPGSGPYEFVIIDSDADGLISPAEWQNATGGGGGGNLGGAFALFDFTPPQRGNLYTAVAYQQGDSGLLDGLTQNFAPVDPDFLVICFATGTLIDTPGGFRAVETLASGDLVLTLDHGPQPVRAVWRGDRPGIGPYAPVHIAAGTLGATRDLRVSQNHRLLLRHPQAELHFGAPEVLVMAKSLVGAVGVRMETLPSVSYVHLFLDRHEIVRASGVLSETVLPVSWLGGRHRALSDAALFGAEPGETGSACRPLLTDAEGRLLGRLVLPRAAADAPSHYRSMATADA
jgi:hypothetical protein